MQKKKNTKFRAVDVIIILLCLSGSIISGLAFWRVYDFTLTRLNDSPIGTISFKKRTAQRKFIDRAVWDRLKQSSVIYNGDTIRTIEFSQATITFKNEVTHLTLAENTLIQIFYDDIEGIKIEFSGGDLEVATGTGSVTIVSGAAQVVVEGQASLNMNDEGFSLAVLEGEAILDGEKIEAGSGAALTESGERALDPSVIVRSFGSSARVLAPSGAAAPVEFSWTTFNFNPDTYVIVEAALNKNFSRIAHRAEVTNAASALLSLEAGNYWWRVYPADSNSRGMPVNNFYPSGTLEVISASLVQLITPASNAQLILPENASVHFSWTAAPNALSYVIEISASANMSNPVISRTSERTTLTITDLVTGQWFWRVTPIFPDRMIGSLPPSTIQRFSRQLPGALVPEPEPVIIAEPEPDPEPEPEPEPEPVIVVPPPPPPPPVIVEPPPVITEPEPRVSPEQQMQVFDTGKITNVSPPNHFTIYTEQLRNTPSIRFSWQGKADQYDFALYRANGDIIVPLSPANGTTFVFDKPATLTAGDYIWHIYERNKRGNGESPDAAIRLVIRNEPMARRPLPTSDPGELYGN